MTAFFLRDGLNFELGVPCTNLYKMQKFKEFPNSFPNIEKMLIFAVELQSFFSKANKIFLGVSSGITEYYLSLCCDVSLYDVNS